jgi:hypothetical protein
MTEDPAPGLLAPKMQIELPPATGGAAPEPLYAGTAFQVHVSMAVAGGAPAPMLAGAGLQVPLPLAGAGAAPAWPLVLFALPPPPAQPLPAWQRDIEGWAVARELQVHAQALWQYGELAYFALMWNVLDFELGLVLRCWRCWDGVRSAPVAEAEQQIAAAYGQGNQYACPVCFNSTFALPEGMSALPGVRALIVRPALFNDYDRAQVSQPRGIFNSSSMDVESTPDFRVRNGDYLFRADNSRWQLKVPGRISLQTGFAHPYQASSAITYNLSRAGLEDPLTVAYRIPPPPEALAKILGTYTRVPASYGWAEVINGPLIPGEEPTPASRGEPQPPAVFPLPTGIGGEE